MNATSEIVTGLKYFRHYWSWKTSKNHCTKNQVFHIKDFFSKRDQIRKKLRIWSHSLRKSLMENFMFLRTNIIKDRGVNLYVNEARSSINVVSFPTNIYFQMYLFTYNFEIKNKSINKQVLLGAPWFSALLREAPQCGKKFLIWCAGVAVCMVVFR